MLFRAKQTPMHVMRPRVTPDPDRAAELERRMSTVAYQPENGFHRDRLQDRICSALPRFAAIRS